MRQGPKAGVWLVLVLTVLVLSGLALFSRPSYADDSVKLKPRLDQVQEPQLASPGEQQSGGYGGAGVDGPKPGANSPWSVAWKFGLATLLAGLLGAPTFSLARRESKGVDWSKVWSFTKGAGIGILKAAAFLVAAVVIGALLLELGIAGLIIIGGLILVGAVLSFVNRWKDQQAMGFEPHWAKTTGVALMDILGISGVIEGVTGKRLLTGELLDPEQAGESFGTGLVQVASLGVGSRILPKGLGRVSAAADESILSRLGRTIGAWWRIKGTPEASFAGVWRVLGAVGKGLGPDDMARVPAPLRALFWRMIEKEALTLSDDGIFRGPAGTLNPFKLIDAILANNLPRIKAIFNPIKGGEAQLIAKEAIENDPNFKRFVGEFRDPSRPGLDAIVEMQDGTFEIVEVKGQESAVGPNNVYKVLTFKDGKPEINPTMLEREITKRLAEQPDALGRVRAAFRRGDGSVTLRVELIGTRPTEMLAGLDGMVVNGVKIRVITRP